jgi:hypothetical protein
MTEPKPLTELDKRVGSNMFDKKDIALALEGLKLEFDEEVDGEWTKSKIDKWFPIFGKKGGKE